MRVDDVPQDTENFYEGRRRAVYAQNADGTYAQTLSKGWAVETFFTDQAVCKIDAEYRYYLQLAQLGKVSPLAVHMAARQMSPKLLADHVGLFTFQVKRHLRPLVFANLTSKKLQRYADALNLSLSALLKLPLDGDDK